MKIFLASPFVLALLVPVASWAFPYQTAIQSNQPAAADKATAIPPSQDKAEQTPAEQVIVNQQKQIAKDPKKLQPYNELALAYLKRARESSDLTYLGQADHAIAKGLAIDANDFQLLKAKVALQLARHQWAEARTAAKVLNKRTPDDVATYGYIAEADFALGDYADAETSAQWMLNMLRNNVPGLVMGAKLRNVYGDPDGAIEFLRMAYAETSPFEVEELAWIANQIAVIQLESGKTDDAAQTLEGAEKLFPAYTTTLKDLASVRMEQGLPKDAVKLLSQAQKQDHDAHTLYLLANALEAAGQHTDATKTLTEFKQAATRQAQQLDDAQLDLIAVSSAKPESATSALTLAQERIAARRDVWTLDAYAWALQANGKSQEADAQIQKAIAIGIKSAQIFDHAGRIQLTLKREDQAWKYFALAMRTDSASIYAADAQGPLAKTGTTGASATSKASPIDSSEQDSAAAVTPSTPAASHPETASLPAARIDASLPAFSKVPESLMIPRPTDTDRIIRNAQARVARDPKDSKGLSILGAAHFQRARETGDVGDYQLAEEALTKSLDLVSTDFSADEPLGTMAEVCMGEHRFTDALSYAQKALSLGSGDVSSFAIVGDAYADMGEYDKASQAYARLTPRDMTLSPRAAYARDSRLAYLKFISGDTAGAVTLMNTAVNEGVEARLPAENLAWLYYELGEFYAQSGKVASADAAYLEALTIYPGDYRALAGLAKLRSNNGKTEEAIVLYQRAIAVVPMPIFIAELGDLYAKTGNQEEAKKQFQLVEYIGLLGHINQVLHNRDLALFYADHDMKLTEALDLAHKEFEVRHDVYTWDALAWALYKNGKYDEAGKASINALKFNTNDALLLYHAGVIQDQIGMHDQARIDFTKALAINPHFHLIYAELAQQKLSSLSAQVVAKDNHAR